MRKYLEVFRISFKMQIIWRFDVLMTMVATVARIAAAWILWNAIFQDRELVSGFTFETMLSYYVVGAIISSIDFSNQVSGEVSWLIKDGGFSKHMVTPMNPMGFFGSLVGGESAFHLGFSLLAAVICSFVFGVSINLSADILSILLAVLIIPMGLAFMAGYHYFVGVMAFKFLDVGFFTHVQDSIIAFATGSMIPLSLLPDAALSVLRFIPFSHAVYTPSMLLTGQMDVSEGLFGLAVVLAGTVAMILIAQSAYHRLRVKYDGVGI
jgi:ABC-2 type transport system permease protein